MKTQLLAAQLIMLTGLSAFAGGVSFPSNPCTSLGEDTVTSAPLMVYLPDGNTEQQVGTVKILSQKSDCSGAINESLDVKVEMNDEIKAYDIKIKGNIIGMEPEVSLDFRLKELVNSAVSFDASTYATTKIHHFGSKSGALNYLIKQPSVLVWQNPTVVIGQQVHAVADKDSGVDSPLACSLDRAYVTLTIKANQNNGLKRDLTMRAFTASDIKACN